MLAPRTVPRNVCRRARTSLLPQGLYSSAAPSYTGRNCTGTSQLYRAPSSLGNVPNASATSTEAVGEEGTQVSPATAFILTKHHTAEIVLLGSIGSRAWSHYFRSRHAV